LLPPPPLLLLLLQVSHMAPELLRFGKMSPAVDVFSFGIMSE
jgi:serine/threonine protein kinase